MKKVKRVLIICFVFLIIFFIASGFEVDKQNSDLNVIEQDVSAIVSESKLTVKYTSLGVPNINSSFKTYMDYRAITNKNSPQYKFIQQYGWVDYEGF